MVHKNTDARRNVLIRRTRGKVALVGLLALASAALEMPARAENFVTNGTFDSDLNSGFNASGGGLTTDSSYTGGTLYDWTVVDVNSSAGLAFLYTAGNQGSKTTNGVGINQLGRFTNFSLFDPGNVAGSTPTGGAIPNTSPGGGNFLVADGASGYNVSIYQTITGLTQNAVYTVSFWYAAGQQSNQSGATTEGWQVSLENSAQITQVVANGSSIQDTPAQADGGLASKGFQAWAQDTLTFTASGSTQVLSFLSLGTPAGQPPVVLLSDIVLTTAPEPASIVISGIGMASLIGLLWFRKNRARNAAASPENN